VLNNDKGSAPSDEEMDMDAFPDDFKVASKGKQKSYEIDYESLTQGAVEKLMQVDIEHISGIFGVDVSQRRSHRRSRSSSLFHCYRIVQHHYCCGTSAGIKSA
jgi:hypothetical protein